MHKQVYKCPNHAANLNNMRLSNRWCDLTIKVDGEEFRAHKNILSANIQFFETMLLGDSFRESNKERVITVECINATDVDAFITYAYTGEISLTDNNALSLLESANYLCEDGIEQACIEFLEKHLKTEQSLRIYNFAKSIDCLSLKNAATSRILLNFENSSQSSEYLDLDFESLADILSDAKAQSVESQLTFFEGTMRWILHDAMKRKIWIDDLLSFIDVSKLSIGYLMKYIGAIASRNDDDSGIVVKDLMSWYYASSESSITKQSITKHQLSEQRLMILGGIDGQFSVQSYNFAERKWSQSQRIPVAGESISAQCAVLNDKFYFIFGKSGSLSLNMFDSSTKLNTLLNSSSSILEWAAVCACSRFVYLCGGQRQDGSKSDQVLRYDPQTNSFESVPSMQTRRAGAAAISDRGCLFVLEGSHDLSAFNEVEKYDPDRRKWMELPSMYNPHAQHAVAVLDGKLYACGGTFESSVEVYDPAKDSWQRVASMNKRRWFFTLVAHNEKLLAIGGEGEQSVEVYDPSKDQWQMDDEMSSGLQMEWNMGGWISPSCSTDPHPIREEDQ